MEFLNIIIIYFSANVLYVGLNTVTTILRVKSGKLISAVFSAICYGFYVYVLVLTADSSNLPTYIKAILTAITNFIGVYVSMWILERTKRDKLWEITATLSENANYKSLIEKLKSEKISFNYNKITSGEYIFTLYSHTQKESKIIKNILDSENAKYIAHEQNIRL